MSRTVKLAPLPAVVAIVLAALVAAPAHAAGATAETFLGLPTWLWMSINLVLFFGILGWLLVPPISRYLDSRGEKIQQDLAEARERRQEVANLQATLGAKVAELEAQMDEVRERAEAEGHREREEVLAQAERERERLIAQAGSEIDHRVAQARQELKDATAALAAQLAQEQIEGRLDETTRHRLFERNLVRLEREEAS
jgi:F-type H+-transporting ATPase subunit b